MEKTVSEYEKKVLQVKTRGLNGCKMLSKYRDQIFGMAALGVIAVHGKTAAYNSPILRKLFEYGGAGVYLFALLSGMGLYFSMTKEKIISGGFGGTAGFYRRRFVRMIIPYGMIGGLWYGIKYLLIERDILGKYTHQNWVCRR